MHVCVKYVYLVSSLNTSIYLSDLLCMQRGSWYSKCCCCHAWLINIAVIGSSWMGWLFKWKVSVGYLSLVCSSSGYGRPINKPWYCNLDVKLCGKPPSIFLFELASCLRCSSGFLLLHSLPICKSNWSCRRIVLCFSRYARGSWGAWCAGSIDFSLQYQSFWCTNTLQQWSGCCLLWRSASFLTCYMKSILSTLLDLFMLKNTQFLFVLNHSFCW